MILVEKKTNFKGDSFFMFILWNCTPYPMTDGERILRYVNNGYKYGFSSMDIWRDWIIFNEHFVAVFFWDTIKVRKFSRFEYLYYSTGSIYKFLKKFLPFYYKAWKKQLKSSLKKKKI
jgi:hypothetical protein